MLRISACEKSVCEYLDKYSILTSRHIQKLCFEGASHSFMMRVLRSLEAQGIIYRVKGEYNEVHAFALSRAGARSLGFKSPLLRLHYRTKDHDLYVNEVRFALEELGLGMDLFLKGT